MRFSEKWLREFVDPGVDTDTLVRQLTMLGLEVDSIEPACAGFGALVTAEVKSVKQHPREGGLYVCEVDAGEAEPLTIVCGAANIRKGMWTVLAKVGAKLPGKPVIEATLLNGVTSHGRLCSLEEIGLGDDDQNIIELSPDETVGRSLTDTIKADDNIIEILLTPNRGDCLSIRGIAREVAVINKQAFPGQEVSPVDVTSKARRNVRLAVPESCPRYLGRVIENVNVGVKSPLWLTEKLRRSGVNSINIVVDVTNFVMLELGQPMHAFDNERLRGDIDVRYAKENETIVLLDDSEHVIQADTLLIADEAGPLALAGLMGGVNSGVTTKTRHVFLESAFFKPEKIMRQARQYGLHTDSSHRFERGVAPDLQRTAIEQASALILMLCGGQAGSITECVEAPHLPGSEPITLRQSEIKRLLGIELDEKFVTNTFARLGMQFKYTGNQWAIKPPSYRFDIKTEPDLIEELARIHGYDAIPVSVPRHNLTIRPLNQRSRILREIRETLINRDFQEVVTYSFVDPALNKWFSCDEVMRLVNPLAPELSEMRVSLWPGLLNTLQYNVKRQQERVRLFETGLVFRGGQRLEQDYRIGGLIYGNRYEKRWDKDDVPGDLYDLKKDIESILSAQFEAGRLAFKAAEIEALHPGQSLEILIDDALVGYLGQLHPQLKSELALVNEICLFEIAMKSITEVGVEQYRPISRFPAVKRDLSILLDETIPFAEVAEMIKSEAAELLGNLELFDVYQGEHIEKKKKSFTFNLTFRATSSTLKDEKVDTIMERIIAGLQNKFGAKLRE